jgi:hypothetical protein
VAKQVFGGYDPDRGPSIALPEATHDALRKLTGRVTISARDLVAFEVRQLRSAGVPRASVRSLVDMWKTAFPDDMKRP